VHDSNVLKYPPELQQDSQERLKFAHRSNSIYAVARRLDDGLELIETFITAGQAIRYIKEELVGGDCLVLNISANGVYQAGEIV